MKFDSVVRDPGGASADHPWRHFPGAMSTMFLTVSGLLLPPAWEAVTRAAPATPGAGNARQRDTGPDARNHGHKHQDGPAAVIRSISIQARNRLPDPVHVEFDDLSPTSGPDPTDPIHYRCGASVIHKVEVAAGGTSKRWDGSFFSAYAWIANRYFVRFLNPPILDPYVSVGDGGSAYSTVECHPGGTLILKNTVLNENRSTIAVGLNHVLVITRDNNTDKYQNYTVDILPRS